MIVEVASPRYTPRLCGQGNSGFQFTLGPLAGISPRGRRDPSRRDRETSLGGVHPRAPWRMTMPAEERLSGKITGR